MAGSNFGGERSSKTGSAYFLVKIMFRKNTSWQGEICRLDKNERVFFRSLFEMVMLMHQAMEENDVPPADYRIRSWRKKDNQDKDSPIDLFRDSDENPSNL